MARLLANWRQPEKCESAERPAGGLHERAWAANDCRIYVFSGITMGLDGKSLGGNELFELDVSGSMPVWTRLHPGGKRAPAARSSAQMVYAQGCLWLWGGYLHTPRDMDQATMVEMMSMVQSGAHEQEVNFDKIVHMAAKRHAHYQEPDPRVWRFDLHRREWSVAGSRQPGDCWGCGKGAPPQGEAPFQICGRCITEDISIGASFCTRQCLADNWKEHKKWHVQKAARDRCQFADDECSPPRERFAACVRGGEELVVWGGTWGGRESLTDSDGLESKLASLWSFSFASRTWRCLHDGTGDAATRPQPMRHALMFAAGGRVYVHGGEDSDDRSGHQMWCWGPPRSSTTTSHERFAMRCPPLLQFPA
jgi:hypothetical protein